MVALIPGAPTIPIQPATYLALFIAPALVDAAYDFPPGATRRFLAPLITFAVVAVILTTGVVAGLASAFLGLPLAAGVVLGAIVAPPDAAAATAVLRNFSLPRSTDAVLKGESLFNDATALLLFGAALTVLSSGRPWLGHRGPPGFRRSRGSVARHSLRLPGSVCEPAGQGYAGRQPASIRARLPALDRRRSSASFCCFVRNRVCDDPGSDHGSGCIRCAHAGAFPLRCGVPWYSP